MSDSGGRPEAPKTAALDLSHVRAFDPLGDGQERDADAALAVDSSRATAWQTENYFGRKLRKAGVGLLFDLGVPEGVTRFKLATPDPGFRFQVRVGNDPGILVHHKAEEFRARHTTGENLTPVAGRYILLWITSVVRTADGSYRAAVSDFKVFGPRG